MRKVNRYRWLAAAGPLLLACAIPALSGASCLGPSFVAGFGVDPVSLRAPPSGWVNVVFQNDSDATARLLIGVTTQTGVQQINYGERFDDPRTSGVGPARSEIRAFECDVVAAESIALELLNPVDVAVLDFVTVQTVGGGTTRRLEQVDTIEVGFLAVNLVGGYPALEDVQCGSNVVFSVSGALVIPERTYFDVISQQTVTGPAFIRNVDPEYPRTDEFILRAQIQ